MKKTIDNLVIEIHENRTLAGQAAGNHAAAELRRILHEKEEARVIFASAPSQKECLDTLVAATGINWKNVTAFHMDEYIGLPKDSRQRFANNLKENLFDRLNFGAVHLLDSDDPEILCDNYAKLLSHKPIDMVCLGVGENGHLAFNDPPVADFNDPKVIKIVELDAKCRHQQVNDGCFSTFDAVPKFAVTLTIPVLLSANCLVCTVPGRSKHDAIKRLCEGGISTDCPASILRKHHNCTLYTDNDCWYTRVG